jgi:DNA-binding response OmpR family regulator
MAGDRKRVLVVEDDADIIELLHIHLEDLNCDVERKMNGREGFETAREGNFDLIVLDVMLPEMDGIAICQKLRALDVFTPILMLTAKSEEFDKVMGLESGADDYLTKPFGIREFIARVKAILRRQERLSGNQPTAKGPINKGDLLIDIEKRKVTLAGNRVNLTPKEFDLLILLAENPGKSYDRELLLSTIWGYEFSGYEHTVNSHVNRLRAKIEPEVNEPKYILTTWGVGYRFNDEI